MRSNLGPALVALLGASSAGVVSANTYFDRFSSEISALHWSPATGSSTIVVAGGEVFMTRGQDHGADLVFKFPVDGDFDALRHAGLHTPTAGSPAAGPSLRC